MAKDESSSGGAGKEKTKFSFSHRKTSDQPLVLPKSVADKQRLHIEKLMRNPDKPVYIPNKPKDWKMREAPEFVRDVMGSSAGAGSGEFHVYRGYRRREYARQMYIQKKAEKEEQMDEFQKKMVENRIQADERTAKKRNKRMKKKQKLLQKKQKLLPKEDEEEKAEEDKDNKKDSSDDEEDEEEEVEESHFIIGGR